MEHLGDDFSRQETAVTAAHGRDCRGVGWGGQEPWRVGLLGHSCANVGSQQNGYDGGLTVAPQMADATPPKKPLCFVIGPIGADGSDVRKHADVLLLGLIKYVLGEEKFPTR